MTYKEIIKADRKRQPGGRLSLFQKTLRRAQSCTNPIMYKLLKSLAIHVGRRNALEIFPETSIGEGFYIGHPYCITINPGVTIGKNCNIHRGALIGKENREKRCGCPKIGNNVWIGINAVIVGNINIGDDVMIAPGAFVNCDVQSHSIVFGNPCQIKHRDNATEQYINNQV